ncbi:hypothetical protein N0V93_003979 [Gnomoniopsis smithogilvyi]|uniref:Zn(2)-C6 fungal-type domain-containing protein n=1 Tax=Gnomoniopsis smithogilvyi TaxID=1191159 RepID=A0A9W8YXN4_9PEZI|nr:hypothetical protein N0V93_003979 [Gnomoniopsis smithogilvyi]
MEKNPKACEPCRRRKVRCDGKTPCNRCEKKPEDCTYRLRTRIRKSGVHRAAAAKADAVGGRKDSGSSGGLARVPTPLPAATGPTLSPLGFSKRVPVEDAGTKSDTAYSNVYQGVAAVHEHGTENSRLFYGPASQFAFLQQVHRSIISSAPQGQADKEVQEGGAGLDLFLQRSFFFGTASRIDTTNLLRPASSLFPEVCIEQARIFLHNFDVWTSRMLPFFTRDELDKMLENLYSKDEHVQNRPSQTKALTLAVLALGALATPQTDIGEMLLAKAKYEAVIFDDTVSLQMIQFSLLLADYHTSMGRPNLVYLSLGTACRKAFALGLHREAANCLTRPEHVQKYRATLWSLYSLESWYAMTVGRETSLKMSDISTPLPEDKPFLVSISRLAHITEKLRTTIYTQRYDSLRKLYQAAEGIHAQLREFAAAHGIGSAHEADNACSEDPTTLMLYNMFYHTLLLVYRPFLVADSALASSPEGQSKGGAGGADAMWLRQACRTAIDSAQDQILHAHNQIRKHETCRTSRYNGYFFESSCAVLFFDILRHPSKFTYNVEYINMALQSLDIMINDEPLTNARRSIQQILRVVGDTISKKRTAGLSAATTPSVAALTDPLLSHDPSLPSPASFLSHDHQHAATANAHVQFPSLSNAPEQSLIYFPDLGGDAIGGNPLSMQGMSLEGETGVGDAIDPLLHFHYDVMATDLYSFFPLNMSPPSATGSAAGVLGEGGSQVR